MSRYIDADALITDLNKGLWGKDWDKVLAEAIINEAPSIEIIRCGECNKRKKNKFCLEHKRYEKDDYGYCSYGEREGER